MSAYDDAVAELYQAPHAAAEDRLAEAQAVADDLIAKLDEPES